MTPIFPRLNPWNTAHGISQLLSGHVGHLFWVAASCVFQRRFQMRANAWWRCTVTNMFLLQRLSVGAPVSSLCAVLEAWCMLTMEDAFLLPFHCNRNGGGHFSDGSATFSFTALQKSLWCHRIIASSFCPCRMLSVHHLACSSIAGPFNDAMKMMSVLSTSSNISSPSQNLCNITDLVVCTWLEKSADEPSTQSNMREGQGVILVDGAISLC